MNRDIEQHCVALMVLKLTGCDDAKAIEAAAMIDRYYMLATPAPQAGRDPEKISNAEVEAAWRECSFPIDHGNVNVTLKAAFAADYRLSHFSGRDPATIEACRAIAAQAAVDALKYYGVAESVGADIAERRLAALADWQQDKAETSVLPPNRT